MVWVFSSRPAKKSDGEINDMWKFPECESIHPWKIEKKKHENVWLEDEIPF